LRYPNLDPDFILQICFEQPSRFDNLFPGFDARRHMARRTQQTAGWVYDNVRYDDNEDVDFWFDQFDAHLSTGQSNSEIFDHMIEQGEWPFPPVIVEATFAATLGAKKKEDLGEPYHLIEGTHRVSYLRRMIQLGMVSRGKAVSVIKLTQ